MANFSLMPNPQNTGTQTSAPRHMYYRKAIKHRRNEKKRQKFHNLHLLQMVLIVTWYNE